MMEQLRPLGVKTLAQFSYYTAKKEKNSGEIAFVETETHNSTSRFADLTVTDFGAV